MLNPKNLKPGQEQHEVFTSKIGRKEMKKFNMTIVIQKVKNSLVLVKLLNTAKNFVNYGKMVNLQSIAQ